MITVIAGVNGAGKSSVVGSWIRAGGGYFNPDEITRTLMGNDQHITLDEANGQAWNMGFDALSRAIATDSDYIFETTLGDNSICNLLHSALDRGVGVRILFCGLSSPELHLKRVAARVAKGGHDIPEEKIRQRWFGSMHNLMTLISNLIPLSSSSTVSPCHLRLCVRHRTETSPCLKLVFVHISSFE